MQHLQGLARRLRLARVDRGQDRLERSIPFGPEDVPDWYAPVARENLAQGALSVADMCAAAVEYSDNTCANLLLARVGGPAALTAFWRATGDAVTRLDHDEPVLNRAPPGDPHDTTTPAAMAGNLRRFVLGDVLSPASRERLTGWMLNCKTGDDRLRGGLPKAWRIADKTGNNGKDASGDIAVAWRKPGAPVLICAYTQGGSPTRAARGRFRRHRADGGPRRWLELSGGRGRCCSAAMWGAHRHWPHAAPARRQKRPASPLPPSSSGWSRSSDGE